MGRTYRRRGRRTKLPHNNEEADEIRLNELMEWCGRHRFRAEGLRPYLFEGSGRGLQTLNCIHPGSVLVEIPKKLLITAGVALQDPLIRSRVTRSAQKPSALVLVSAFLLLEKSKGDKSFYYHYINSLPTLYTTTLYLDDGDLDVLDDDLLDRHNRLKRSVQTHYCDMLSIFGDSLDWCSNGQFLWAWHVINTRSVFMEQPPHGLVKTTPSCPNNFALAPFLDLLNHTDSAQITAVYDDIDECYRIITRDTYRKYDQVFISYGGHDNRTLLTEYGFCIHGNVNDSVNISLCTIINDFFKLPESLQNDGKKLLESCNAKQGLVCDASGASWSLQECVKIIASMLRKSYTNIPGSDMASLKSLLALEKTKRINLMDYIDIHRKLGSSKESQSRSFTVDMAKVLYENEVHLLQKAVDNMEVT